MTENPTAAAHLRHQLRTPLNHIIGYTEMLLEDAEGPRPELVADLRGIHSAAHRLLVLVNEYLESPKGQTGAADPVGLTAPFTAAIDLIIASAERVTKHAGGTALRSDLAKICSAAEQLLGVMMPEMDGVEVLRRLKSHAEWRDLPVLMISALDEIDSVVRCIELGAEDYLAKPFDSVLLRARIGACLEKKRFRDQEARHLEALAE